MPTFLVHASVADGQIATWIAEALQGGPGWQKAGILAALSLATVLLMRYAPLLKRAHRKAAPWIAVALATLASVTDSLVAGGPWRQALGHGVEAGLMAAGAYSAAFRWIVPLARATRRRLSKAPPAPSDG